MRANRRVFYCSCRWSFTRFAYFSENPVSLSLSLSLHDVLKASRTLTMSKCWTKGSYGLHLCVTMKTMCILVPSTGCTILEVRNRRKVHEKMWSLLLIGMLRYTTLCHNQGASCTSMASTTANNWPFRVSPSTRLSSKFQGQWPSQQEIV